MADFIYDEMVTAQSLNEIAVDLGAGDFSVFTENTPYAVDKLNEITQSLVGSGISSALNKFKITVNAKSVVVGTGIAFFESGKKLKLTTPVTLSFKSGELYLYENPSTGMVSINIGELPTDNYIHLATINQDLTFTDKRMIAKAKVELPTEANSYIYKEILSEETFDDYNNKTLTFQLAGVQKIFIRAGGNEEANFLCLYEYDISTQVFTGIHNRVGIFPTELYINFNESEVPILNCDYPNETIRVQVLEQTTEYITFSFRITGERQKWSRGDGEFEVCYCVLGGVEK